MNYKLIDEHGRQLDMNRSLVALRSEWGREAKEEFADLHETPSEYTRLSDWTFGELPELMEVPVGKQTVIGYPALIDDGETVSLKVFDSAEEARIIDAFQTLSSFSSEIFYTVLFALTFGDWK